MFKSEIESTRKRYGQLWMKRYLEKVKWVITKGFRDV